MERASSPLPHARQVLAGYYREHGTMPSIQRLAELLGVSSTSSAHYVVRRLREDGYLSATEHGRLTPGPQFSKAPGRPELPGELLKTLPQAEGLKVFWVEEDWSLFEGCQFAPGDLLLLSPIEQFTAGDLVVLSRGTARAVSRRLRSGWAPLGVLRGQYRAFNPAAERV